MRRIKITIGPVELYAKLLDTPAGNVIRNALPFASRARVADSTVLFSTPEHVSGKSGSPGLNRPGDFVFCSRRGACSIDFGNLPFTRSKRRSPRRTSDVWARAMGDIAALKHVIDGDPVAVEGVD